MKWYDNFTLETKSTNEDVWCPTTTTGNWLAFDPETSEEFITGNCTHFSPYK